MFVLLLMDIFMLRQQALRWDAQQVALTDSVALHPYHFWVMTVFYLSAQACVALSYWFHKKDEVGAIVLFGCGAVFSLFAVQDVLFFALQGEPLPSEWTWLYWQNLVFGSPLSAQFVLALAGVGSLLIAVLFYGRLSTLRPRH